MTEWTWNSSVIIYYKYDKSRSTTEIWYFVWNIGDKKSDFLPSSKNYDFILMPSLSWSASKCIFQTLFFILLALTGEITAHSTCSDWTTCTDCSLDPACLFILPLHGEATCILASEKNSVQIQMILRSKSRCKHYEQSLTGTNILI